MARPAHSPFPVWLLAKMARCGSNIAAAEEWRLCFAAQRHSLKDGAPSLLSVKA